MSQTHAALVTGVGRAGSIAHGIARALAADGWSLGLVTLPSYDREVFGTSPNELDQFVAELRGLDADVHVIEGDLSDLDTPARLVDEAVGRLGILDALVLSHSHSIDSSILDTTPESWDRHFAVNARAAWLMIRAFAEQAGPTGGAIVALTSDHVIHNLPYGASKGALDRLVVAAAGELGHRGIRANSVNPGPIDTGWMDDAIRASGLARQPTGRFGTPADTAQLVRFLVSDEGAWITGQLIKSDGGFST